MPKLLADLLSVVSPHQHRHWPHTPQPGLGDTPLASLEWKRDETWTFGLIISKLKLYKDTHQLADSEVLVGGHPAMVTLQEAPGHKDDNVIIIINNHLVPSIIWPLLHKTWPLEKEPGLRQLISSLTWQKENVLIWEKS